MRALNKCREEAGSEWRALAAAWAEMPIYAVGERTAAALSCTLDGAPVRGGAQAANARQLADLVLADHASRTAGDAIAAPSDADAAATSHGRRPLLFLGGDKRRHELPDALAAANVPLVEKTVYRSLPSPEAGAQTAAAVAQLRVRIVGLFSPLGVRAVLPSLAPLLQAGRVRLASIGPMTTSAIVEEAARLGLDPHLVAANRIAEAAKPTPAALSQAIQQLLAS